MDAAHFYQWISHMDYFGFDLDCHSRSSNCVTRNQRGCSRRAQVRRFRRVCHLSLPSGLSLMDRGGFRTGIAVLDTDNIGLLPSVFARKWAIWA